MDKTAVEAISDLAVRADRARTLNTFTPALVVGSGDSIKSLEYLQPGRSRYRGNFATYSIAAFVAYVLAARENGAADGQAQGFVNPDGMKAGVFFNLGTADKPGHGDHTATLTLKATAAFAALIGACGTHFNQRDLHSWLEDWREHLVPQQGDGDYTTGMAGALAAVREVTVERARSETNVVTDFGANRSAMESVDAKSSKTLPTAFDFTCVPYEGLKLRAFRLRLGVNTAGDKLTFTLRLQQAEAVTEAIANEFLDVLTAQIGTASSLTLGTFTP